MSRLRIIIIYIFLIWFSIRICYLIFNLLLAKERINSLGKKISILPNLVVPKRKLYLFIVFDSFFVFSISLLLLILTKDIVFLLGCLFPSSLILRCLLTTYLSRKNGVYEKGIILGMFIKYNQIRSYKIKTIDEILLSLRNGRAVNLKVNEGNNEIIELFEHNQIPRVQTV
ncbi:hypothetical protein [Treponema socranskii]|uniref:hypothetical protein n=1 Tax=Treponema socranskii TaxID=53419 RepID=UPI0028E4C13E|nr:hypothetical protein [Treponema socranskii]